MIILMYNLYFNNINTYVCKCLEEDILSVFLRNSPENVKLIWLKEFKMFRFFNLLKIKRLIKS